MKKLVALVMVGLMVMALPSGAVAGKKKKKKKPPPQVVEGTIAAPARHPDGCYTGLSRHAWSLAGEGSNGAVGWTFDVDKKTWNQPFVLEPTGGVGTVDLDISYYLGDFHSQEDWLNEPVPAAPATSEYETHEGPGESNRVPKGAVKAIICVYAGEGGQGAAGVPFTYKAGKTIKIKKS